MITENILLIGCGKMGGALLGGLLPNLESKDRILVVNPTTTRVEKAFGIRVIADLQSKDDLQGFKVDTVIIAIKPQMAVSILSGFDRIFDKKTLFISVVAGKTVDFLKQQLGKDAKIVRAMPNLPCLIKRGITGAYLAADNKYRQRAEDIFNSVGELIWVDDEGQIDAVTAISGSGPAYLFNFAEGLINSAVELGLPHEMAVKLAKATIAGSAEMLQKSDKTAGELKEEVRSPKGTTDAALNILDGDLEYLLKRATDAAYRRSKELAE